MAVLEVEVEWVATVLAKLADAMGNVDCSPHQLCFLLAFFSYLHFFLLHFFLLHFLIAAAATTAAASGLNPDELIEQLFQCKPLTEA